MTPDELAREIERIQASFDEVAKGRGRGWRDKADPLTLEYEDYRRTKLWKGISASVLSRDKGMCMRCGGKADLVHHMDYSDPVMLGKADENLVSLCEGCHEVIHFDSIGNKRSQAEWGNVLSDMSFNEKPPKVDLRLTVSKPAVWKRLTALQKKEWSLEFARRKYPDHYRKAFGDEGQDA